MNKEQKEILQQQLDNEKKVLNDLKKNYQDALDEINTKIEILMARQDADMQHVIYQVEYQKALKTQVQSILDQLHTNSFETVSEYLTNCYEDGFIGTMYDLQGQGIPLVIPMDQEQVVAAIQHETKLSESLYTSLGKDIKDLQKKISSEISRGISTGQMYAEISRNIAAYAGISRNNAMRIARTEGHRIQCKSTLDAQHKAKENGADVVKQWDSTLDGKTRDTHRKLDGQIRELDEDFEVYGMKAEAPGMFGVAAEDINCRCALLQRARWALGNDYTKWSPDAPVLIDDNGTTQLIKIDAKNMKEFKGIYQDITGQMTMNMGYSNERVRSSSQKINNQDTLDKIGKNSKIKSVELPPETSKISGMTNDTKEAISNAFDNIKAEYNVNIDNLVVESLGKGNEKVPFQYIPENVGGFLKYKVAINKDYYFNDGLDKYTERIMRNFNSGALASQNIEDLLAHEMAHVMTFQDCDTYGVFERVEEEVRESFIRGMSDYADSTFDGAETIAEAFVRYRRGEELPDNVMNLLDKYILGRKR